MVLIIQKNARVCNSKAIVRPVALQQTLRDLPLQLLADAGTGLHRARQSQQAHHRLSSTHQLNPCHAAVTLQPLNNQTTRCIRQILVVALCHAPSRHPVTCKCTQHGRMSHTHHALRPQLPTGPAYQVDMRQILESSEVEEQRLHVVVLQLLQSAV